MKIGIISNSELCIPMLHSLKTINAELKFYLGRYPLENKKIENLIAFCKTNNISIEEEHNPEQLYEWIEKQQTDFIFIFGYKNLIDIKRLGTFANKTFNIHPGKLPEYRGPNPVFWQIKNGEKSIGLTIHLLSSKLDAGPIVWHKEIPNEPHFTSGLVDFIFSNLFIEGVFYILNSNINELIKQAISQDENKASFYKKPELKDVLIDWKNMSSDEIVNLVKACNPWNMGAITVYKNLEIKIIDAESIHEINSKELPGTILEVDKSLKVMCSSHSVLKVNYLNINGIFVSARFANKFGFAAKEVFCSE